MAGGHDAGEAEFCVSTYVFLEGIVFVIVVCLTLAFEKVHGLVEQRAHALDRSFWPLLVRGEKVGRLRHDVFDDDAHTVDSEFLRMSRDIFSRLLTHVLQELTVLGLVSFVEWIVETKLHLAEHLLPSSVLEEYSVEQVIVSTHFSVFVAMLLFYGTMRVVLQRCLHVACKWTIHENMLSGQSDESQEDESEAGGAFSQMSRRVRNWRTEIERIGVVKYRANRDLFIQNCQEQGLTLARNFRFDRYQQILVLDFAVDFFHIRPINLVIMSLYVFGYGLYTHLAHESCDSKYVDEIVLSGIYTGVFVLSLVGIRHHVRGKRKEFQSGLVSRCLGNMNESSVNEHATLETLSDAKRNAILLWSVHRDKMWSNLVLPAMQILMYFTSFTLARDICSPVIDEALSSGKNSTLALTLVFVNLTSFLSISITATFLMPNVVRFLHVHGSATRSMGDRGRKAMLQ
ncbi:MAG: hypothetical protein MHM6MM_008164, partial [Cercozoa sp. M6MM]